MHEFGYADSHPVTVPANPNVRLDAFGTDSADSHVRDFPYKAIIGSLFFASLGSRPDIAFAVSSAAKFSDRATKAHCAAVGRIMKYLRGTPHLGITYSPSSPPHQLLAYCDSDYAGDLDDRKSRSGVLLMFNNGPIAWISRKQSATAGSTTEAEYMAAHLRAKEVTWLRRLLASIGQPQLSPTPLYSDNQACIRLVHNPEFHRCTKHIDVAYHIIREYQAHGEILITYVGTRHQLADLLTKALPSTQFQHLLGLIGMSAVVTLY